MLEDVPIIKENVELIYEDITSDEVIEKFGVHIPPVILINKIDLVDDPAQLIRETQEIAGDVPVIALISALPSLPPAQLTSDIKLSVKPMASGSVRLTCAVSLHPFASVIITQ